MSNGGVVDTGDTFPKNYPSDEGVDGKHGIIASVQSLTGSGTITGAVMQYKAGERTWKQIPDPDGDEDVGAVVAASAISGYQKPILGGKDIRFRLNVPSAPSENFEYALSATLM